VTNRSRARELAAESLARGDAVGWFETLYREAEAEPDLVPWADRVPNPSFVTWCEQTRFDFANRRCLDVGCGLGDNAEHMARAGARVTAFDVSPSAVAACRARFPESSVRYETADLLHPPAAWDGAFDFVLEVYTLQVLPPEPRRQALSHLARFVAPGGALLIVCRGRDPEEATGHMPWPLTRSELALPDLTEISFEDFLDDESPPVRRFRVLLRG
jgi:SAM-dependent methyltransferase